MTLDLKKALLFSLGCLGTRFGLVILAKYLYDNNQKYLKNIGYITLIPGISFLIIYMFGLR